MIENADLGILFAQPEAGFLGDITILSGRIFEVFL